jgi:hypothetical protein
MKNPGAKHFRAGVPEKNARWLAKGQRGETSTKLPPAEMPLLLSGLGWWAATGHAAVMLGYIFFAEHCA